MVSPLPTIVTLAQAKKAARIFNNDENDDLHARLEEAHEMVLDFANNRIDDSDDAWLDTILSWDADSAPRRVKGAIKAVFTYMVRYRGDDPAKDWPDATEKILRFYLDRLRDPTVA